MLAVIHNVMTLKVVLHVVLGHFRSFYVLRVRPDITVMVDWALKINYLFVLCAEVYFFVILIMPL